MNEYGKKIKYDDYLLWMGLYDSYRIIHGAEYTDDVCKFRAMKQRAAYEMAQSIIGVQPITGPVAQIYMLKNVTVYKLTRGGAVV